MELLFESPVGGYFVTYGASKSNALKGKLLYGAFALKPKFFGSSTLGVESATGACSAIVVTGRSGPRGIGGRRLLAVHRDQFLKVFDPGEGERRGILFAYPVDGDDAVFGFHLDDDFVEEILVLLQHFGDPGEGKDGRDSSHAQAALAALMPRCFQFHGSSSSMRAGS